ncbi:hypothetical protein MNBD_CHLOROFLEXI01-868 [hydrothermal vent metagenome]|uniref:LiaF transmembrane domain-containing protein n=1 Tax=hydrothermal vent metagenome TaxID=652676 RepID=A0A3B0V5U4_9ZZZZ
MTDTIDSLKDAEKEAMANENHSRQVCWQSGSSTGGFILIGLGLYFLLSRTTGFYLHNWWALFILIPAVHNLKGAWHSYRVNGRFHDQARGSLLSGILFTMVALFFLFNLSWSLFWPIALILVGANALINIQNK